MHKLSAEQTCTPYEWPAPKMIDFSTMRASTMVGPPADLPGAEKNVAAGRARSRKLLSQHQMAALR